MSEAQSTLPGATGKGTVTVRDAGPCGMITLRGDMGAPALAKAVKDAAGVAVPGQREIVHGNGSAVAWMSPDELLVMTDHGKVDAALAAIDAALKGGHYLAVDVSDARAVFEVTGQPGAVREAIAKLCPVDMAPDAFATGQIRRTRMGQVAAAFWMVDEGTVRVVCFRSVAEYVHGLLLDAGLPGGEVGLFG